jgi:hypothetical protein
MEKESANKVIPLNYIRGLLIAQNGRCAITGMLLHPQDVNADHIVPLSREELAPTRTEENIWLVSIDVGTAIVDIDEMLPMHADF